MIISFQTKGAISFFSVNLFLPCPLLLCPILSYLILSCNLDYHVFLYKISLHLFLFNFNFVGAMPGKPIQSLKTTGCSNPLILIDEVYILILVFFSFLLSLSTCADHLWLRLQSHVFYSLSHILSGSTILHTFYIFVIHSVYYRLIS